MKEIGNDSESINSSEEMSGEKDSDFDLNISLNSNKSGILFNSDLKVSKETIE